MKLAIMQPYLFPYLGYFQLIHAVDEFVVYDDVNFINRGWINRNNILMQGKAHLITLDMEGASQNKKINEVQVGNNRVKLLKTIRQSYAKAPQFEAVFPLIAEILEQPETNLASFLDYGLRRICDYLALHPRWHLSSALNKDNSLRGQDKIMAICEALGASRYINMPGGKELYNQENFAKKSMQLSFIQPQPVAYNQFGNPFVANLSIIDVLMFNTKDEIRANLIGSYALESN